MRDLGAGHSSSNAGESGKQAGGSECKCSRLRSGGYLHAGAEDETVGRVGSMECDGGIDLGLPEIAPGGVRGDEGKEDLRVEADNIDCVGLKSERWIDIETGGVRRGSVRACARDVSEVACARGFEYEGRTVPLLQDGECCFGEEIRSNRRYFSQSAAGDIHRHSLSCRTADGKFVGHLRLRQGLVGLAGGHASEDGLTDDCGVSREVAATDRHVARTGGLRQLLSVEEKEIEGKTKVGLSGLARRELNES